VHNLEHGYVNVFWDQDAPAEQVEALKNWARGEIDGEHPKMVVAPWTGEPFAEGSNFAFVGWNARQMCGQFDPDVGQVFTTNYYGNDGLAPQQERNIAAHQPDGQGVYDPTEANVLLPPLDTELGGDAPNEADLTGTETPAGADPTEGATAPATEPASS
jgi:hypothetical protein